MHEAVAAERLCTFCATCGHTVLCVTAGPGRLLSMAQVEDELSREVEAAREGLSALQGGVWRHVLCPPRRPRASAQLSQHLVTAGALACFTSVH